MSESSIARDAHRVDCEKMIDAIRRDPLNMVTGLIMALENHLIEQPFIPASRESFQNVRHTIN